MAELKSWNELRSGGVLLPGEGVRPQTGTWRTGVKPEVDLSKCVNCLLCWVYCPDSAVELAGTTFTGFDLTYCKGCEICAEVCPVDAVTMVAEEITS